MIEKSLVERDLGLMVSSGPHKLPVRLLYVSLVRPHLEFAVPSREPIYEKLENIQHRATRLAPNLRKKGCESIG